MRRPLVRTNIRPKISTMPRQQSEAAAFLDIYKLTVEKKRLQQELEAIEDRRERIAQRLEVLEQQIGGLEKNVQQLRDDQGQETEKKPNASSPRAVPSEQSGSFEMFTLDY